MFTGLPWTARSQLGMFWPGAGYVVGDCDQLKPMRGEQRGRADERRGQAAILLRVSGINLAGAVWSCLVTAL